MSSNEAQDAMHSTAGKDRPVPEHGHTAHHISEFGEVENIVHIQGPARPSVDDELPAPPISRKDKIAKRERFGRLSKRLFHQRHLHQFFCNDTLYRTHGSRSVGPDELFMDLVIVGGFAALGHELRESFQGWREVEKFFLLFSAVYSSWRSIVFMWNLWGVASDLTDKLSIYAVFTCLTGIALGAHGAFSDGPRPYVAIASFLATGLPIIIQGYWTLREPLTRNAEERISYLLLLNMVSFVTILPYFAAAFVRSDRTTRILYWVAAGLHLVSTHVTTKIYELSLRGRPPVKTRLAVNIELMVEKFETLTMIVLGEAVLGLLFEAALVVTKSEARLGVLYASAAAGTAMLYSLQTLYNNVDSPIAKGGKHAIRYKRLHGILWSQMHFPYHAALVLFATGLGLAVHDVTLGGKAADHATDGGDAIHMALASAMRASDGSAAVSSYFGRDQRWLFSVGWGASIILSGLIGSFHLAGPRAATKRYRFFTRCAVVIAVMVGMPFADVSAEHFIAVYTTVLILIAVVEYTFVHMDRMGFFRSEASLFTSSTDGQGKESPDFSDDRDDDDDTADDDDDDDFGGGESGDVESGQGADGQPGAGAPALENLEVQVGCPAVARALQARLCRGHSKRLVAASKRVCQRETCEDGDPYV